MITDTRKGKVRKAEHSAQLMAGYDDEEDYTIVGGNLSLESGTLGSGLSRADLLCLGIHNYGAAAVTICYRLLNRGDDIRTLRINSGDTFAPMPPIVTIIGSAGGSTLGATIKLMYWDKHNYDGDGIMQRTQT